MIDHQSGNNGKRFEQRGDGNAVRYFSVVLNDISLGSCFYDGGFEYDDL